MLKLFISKSKVMDEKETVILAILNGLQCNKYDRLFASITEIAYILTGRWIDTRNKDRRLYNNLKSGLESLANRKLITILDQNGDNYVISNDGLEVDTEKEKFAVVELWEMQKIFSEANKPFNVFLFFVNLVETINNTTKEWHMSQEDMAAQWGYGKETVNSYLEQLEKMELIYVYRYKKRKADGTYHKLNNSYGRYADKESVVEAARKYADTVECEDFFERIDRRGIKLRYNAFCNNAKKYQNNPDAIAELYKECQSYNKSLEYRPIEEICDGEWKKVEGLDLSVFPDDIVNDETGDWGELDSIENNLTVAEMIDMSILSDNILFDK